MNTGKKQSLIEFDHVTVTRGGRTVLKDISFSVRAGENVAIVGHNGSGKSTLIKTIVRELYPAYDGRGRVTLFGEEQWDVFALRRRLGIVSDELVQKTLLPITCRETVLSGFFSSIGLFYNHAVTPAMEQKTDAILAFLEIAHLADRRMDELSSGEAHRVLIGRALVHEPAALILDEPGNSLDLHAHYRFRETLRRIAGQGTSIVLVTHDISDIIPEIGRVILLKDGAIFRDDHAENVLAPSVLSEFFSIPVEVHRRSGFYHVF